MADLSQSDPAAETDGDTWREEIAHVDRTGDVSVSLSRGPRALLLQLSPTGSRQRVLERTPMGDVSYRDVRGMTEREAADVARAYARRLEAGKSAVPRVFPHLLVAGAEGRATGSRRSAIAALWPEDQAVPSERAELRLDPDGIAAFLAPELSVDGPPFEGHVLRAIHHAPDQFPGESYLLELEPSPAGEAIQDRRVVLSIGPHWEDGVSFGAPSALALSVATDGQDRAGNLSPAVARLCSRLVALFELKQASQVVSPARSIDGRALKTSVSTPAPPAAGRTVSHPAEPFPIDIHRFALLTSGYTVVRAAFSRNEIGALCVGVDRALDAVRKVLTAGRELSYTFYDGETYLGTRCVYCWGEACLRLLERDLIQRISAAVIGPHKLFDMTAHSALPARGFGRERLEGWHRDIDVTEDSPPNVRYLWFFIYLDDFTAENGATWIVPGTQRMPNDRVPDASLGADRFPTQVQLCGEAGDVVIINPSALHSVGYNTTDRQRRMVNVSICHTDVRPLLDHWAIAGPAIQEHASPRLRDLLGADGEWPPDTTWTVLPDGWQTAQRSSERVRDPATRVLPIEQQGYQRSHRKR